jgi:hypothetical protein
MFDTNSFKRQVKDWIRNHPEGTENDLQDFCEEKIPPAQYATLKWMVDHTLSWYRYVLINREMGREQEEA